MGLSKHALQGPVTRSTLRPQADFPRHLSLKKESESAPAEVGGHWSQAESEFKIHSCVALSRARSISESLFSPMGESSSS